MGVASDIPMGCSLTLFVPSSFTLFLAPLSHCSLSLIDGNVLCGPLELGFTPALDWLWFSVCSPSVAIRSFLDEACGLHLSVGKRANI